MKPKNLLPLLAAGILCPAAAYSAEVANAAADFVQGANIGDPTTATGWTYLASDTATDVATGSNQLIWEAQVGNVGATEGYGVGPTTGNLDLPAVVGTNDNGGDYEIFADGADANGNANAYGGHGAVVGTDLLLHPSNQANELYLILRYTIQPGDLADGTTAIIAGSFRDLSGFDTTNSGLNANQMRQAGSIHAQVFYNSTQLWEASGADGTLTQANGTFNLTQTGVSVGETISFVIDRNPLGDTNGGTQNGDETALQASIDIGTPSGMDPPTIVVNPTSQDLYVGDTLSLSVTATGTAPFTYQWRKGMVDIGGATSQTFEIPSVALGDAGDYDCVVSNGFAPDATSATATVTVSIEPPTITTQPVSQTLVVGETLNLSVVVEGTAPITYQWYKDFAIIPGETSDTLTITNVGLADAGEYDCEVDNPHPDSSIFSDTVMITVRTNDAPVSSAPDVATNENVTLTLLVDDLATDGDGDPLTIVGSDATSVDGAAISFNGSKIAYFPVPDSTVTDDTFTVDVNDGYVTTIVTVTVDVVAVSSTVVGDPALDYVDSATLPANWTYFRSDATTGGAEVALVAATGLGNGGNTGFGHPAGDLDVPAVLGAIDGGAEFEIFGDGFDGNGTNLLSGNEGLPGVDLLMSPGKGDLANNTVIARYTFDGTDITNFGSTATVSGSFRDLAGGTTGGGAGSVIASVYLNGTELWTATGAEGRLFEADGTFDLSGGVTVTAGDTLSFVVNNNGNYGGDETALRAAISLSMDPPAASGFDSWIAGFSGLSDDTASGDPDLDGTVNLIEYVLDGNPGVSDPEILPTGEIVGSDLVYSFTRRAESPTDTTQVFQFGEDLVNWADVPIDGVAPLPAGVTVDRGTPAGGLQTVTVTIDSSLAPNGKGFGRLNVTEN